jgi:hypothetical protein
MSKEKKTNNWIIGTTVLLYIGPIIADLLINGFNRVFSYFAADVFYYLTIARNYAQYGFYTFDQLYPTNGFQPLWQFLLGFLYQGLSVFHASDEAYLVVVILVNLLVISLAIIILGKCFVLLNGRVPILFILLPVGVYSLIIAPIYSQYGTLWSFTNGMESGLTLLFYGILMWLTLKTEILTRPSVKNAVLIGVVLGFVFLSRLDHAFLTVAFLSVLGIHYLATKQYKWIWYLVLSGLIVGTFLVVYLAFNYVTVGAFMPISGATKSSFPHPNFEKIFGILSLIKDPGQAWAAHSIARHAQLDIPAVTAFIGVIYIIIAWVKKKQQDIALFVLEINVLFVLLFWGYNFFFVNLWSQGHWYYPVSILFVSLFVCYLADRWLQSNISSLASIPVLFLLGTLFFSFVYRSENYNSHYANLFNQRNEISDFYGNDAPKIIEIDDGIIAYSTGFEAMSGLGFALDKEAMLAKEEHRLLYIALERGFNRIATLNYFNWKGVTMDMSSTDIHTAIKDNMLNIPGLDDMDLKVEYISTNGNFAIIYIIPR